MNARIKKLRKALDLTQQEFADKIGMKRNTVANYETDRNEPSNAVVSLICKTFGVSEAWLRNGVGGMFVERTEEEELAQVFSAITASDDELIKRIIRAYWRLDDKEKAAVKKLIDGFASEVPADPPDNAAAKQAEMEREVEQEVERYRQQLLSEKQRESQALSARESGAG